MPIEKVYPTKTQPFWILQDTGSIMCFIHVPPPMRNIVM